MILSSTYSVLEGYPTKHQMYESLTAGKECPTSVEGNSDSSIEEFGIFVVHQIIPYHNYVWNNVYLIGISKAFYV